MQNYRKSKYGKNLTYLFEPEKSLKIDNVLIKEVPSTFNPTEELKAKVINDWDPVIKGEDGTKWRYEGSSFVGKKYIIGVSPIMYSEHDILRKISGLKPEEYPTPFTVNTIQITQDNYFMLGIRGGGSDQRGLAALGSGFCDRHIDEGGKNIPPSHPFNICLIESLEETLYSGKFPFSNNNGFLGIVRGGNTDVAAIFFQYLNVNSNQITNNLNNLGYNGKPEHSGIYALELSRDKLEKFLELGGIEGYSGVGKLVASDHLLGGVELLLKNWDKL